MEQVISLDVARLTPSRRNLRTILRPIFQLMRFYLQETSHYTHLLRRFRPTVFPQILGSLSRVFELAQDEMLRRFRAQGCQGLGVALSEGVAALDRLSQNCIKGATKALVSSVLWPLKTMESLRRGRGHTLILLTLIFRTPRQYIAQSRANENSPLKREHEVNTPRCVASWFLSIS
jgi:hypothetical protein